MKLTLLLCLFASIASNNLWANEDYYESENPAQSFIEEQEESYSETYDEARIDENNIPSNQFTSEPQVEPYADSDYGHAPDYAENYDMPVDDYYEE